MTIYIGADHRGFDVKEKLKLWLTNRGDSVIDCGNTKLDPADDYPDFAFAVADKVVADPTSRGIILCGSGGGVVFAANKVKGVRCVPANDVSDVIHNRNHNDVNVLGIGTDHTTWGDMLAMITAFLDTPFESQERFLRRLKKIQAREV